MITRIGFENKKLIIYLILILLHDSSCKSNVYLQSAEFAGNGSLTDTVILEIPLLIPSEKMNLLVIDTLIYEFNNLITPMDSITPYVLIGFHDSSFHHIMYHISDEYLIFEDPDFGRKSVGGFLYKGIPVLFYGSDPEISSQYIDLTNDSTDIVILHYRGSKLWHFATRIYEIKGNDLILIESTIKSVDLFKYYTE